jgi:hypothetical protein
MEIIIEKGCGLDVHKETVVAEIRLKTYLKASVKGVPNDKLLFKVSQALVS